MYSLADTQPVSGSLSLPNRICIGYGWKGCFVAQPRGVGSSEL